MPSGMFGRMKKIILRTRYPWIATYPIFANPLSILQCVQYTYNYIYSSFIQIICCKKNGAISFYDFNYRYCPLLNIQRISKEFMKEQSNYIESIKFFINKGYYLYMLVNPKYISIYHSEEDWCHDLFVFGYDDESRSFHIADNFTGKYEQRTCSYQELENAINNLPYDKEGYLGFNGCIELLSNNKDMKYVEPFLKENIIRIKDSFSNYVEGYGAWNDSSLEMRVEPYGYNKFQYGIDCYQFLIDNLLEKGISNIHFPSYFLIYDHKKHIQRIIFYLEETGRLKNGKLYKEKVDELVKMSDINVNLILKDRVVYSKRTEERIIENYKKMEFIERVMIERMLNDIRI